jgi:hypothetical protein
VQKILDTIQSIRANFATTAALNAAVAAVAASAEVYTDAVPRFAVAGAVDPVGVILRQTGTATVSDAAHPLTGVYVVPLAGMTSSGIVLATATGATGPSATAQAVAESGQFSVYTFRNNAAANVPFSFAVIAL